jgi:uncharacterized protein YqeY
MSLKADLQNEFKDAMRAKDEMRKTTLRMALAAIKQIEVDEQKELDDADVLRVLQKEVKLRQEGIAEAETADRPDLVEEGIQEIAVLEAFLPQALSEAELETLVAETIAEVGASSPADMGNVMKAVMPKIAGRADGGQVSQMVRQKLQSM